MTQARRERDLFLQALDLPDGAARRAFLDRACAGDASLRDGVEVLLSLHQRGGSFLDEPLPEQVAARFVAPPTVPPRQAEAGGEPSIITALLPPADAAGGMACLGRIRLREALGESAFGPVVAGVDESSGMPVTVRFLAPHAARAPGIRGRFLHLARHLAAIRHDTLPPILAVGEAPLPHVVVAAHAGAPLASILGGGKAFAPAVAACVGMQVAEGLAAAHDAGLVHRALGPRNILVDGGARPRVWLCDVGLARSIDEEAWPGADPPGRDDAFLAPEQVLGDRLDHLDHRPDLFALGSLIVALVTGRSPFAAATPEATLRRLAEADPLPGVLELVPEPLREIVCDLLQADPARRPDSASRVSLRLSEIAGA